MDSPKGWTNQDNGLLRSNKWTPKADMCPYLIRPPRRAEAKRGGEDERSEDGEVNFCRSESQSSVQEVGVSREPCASHLCVARRGYYLLFAEPSREKAGRSVYTQPAVASLRLAGIHSG